MLFFVFIMDIVFVFNFGYKIFYICNINQFQGKLNIDWENILKMKRKIKSK